MHVQVLKNSYSSFSMSISSRKRPFEKVSGNDTTDHAFEVVYGRLQAKRHEYQAFYGRIRASVEAPYTSSYDPHLSSQEIQHTLNDILVFLSEQLDLARPYTGGVHALEYLSARELRRSTSLGHERTLNELSKQVIALCLQIFSYMFGADNYVVCYKVVSQENDDQWVATYSPARLRYSMLQHNYAGNKFYLQDPQLAFVYDLYHELCDYILSLDKILSGILINPLDHVIFRSFRTGKFEGLYEPLLQFTNDLRGRDSMGLTFDDIRVLLTEIVGPFLDQYHPHSPVLKEKARKCMRYGKFAQYGTYLIHFAQLVNSHQARFKYLFPVMPI